MPDPSLLKRLKERKLVQWAIAYLAGAWVIFEATGTALEAWNISNLLIQAIHVLLVMGFFITLVLAWYHGEKGRQRVSGPELLMVAALLVIAGGVLWMLGGSDSTSTISGRPRSEFDGPSLIILTCDNISPRPEDAYLADGLHEAILLKLAGVPGILLLGRETAKWYRDNPKPPSEIAAERNLDFVGECSVRKNPTAERIMVTFQLLNSEGVHEWSEEYQGDFATEDLFEIQRGIAQQVAERVGAVLSPADEERIASIPTGSLEAYDHYLRGREALRRRSASDIQAAFRFFEAALEEDGRFAEAHAGMADAWIHRGWEEADTAYFRRGREAADRALALDSLLSEAHLSKAYTMFYGDWDWVGSERSFQTAIRLDPNNSTAHQWYGEYLSARGRFDAGVEETSVALAMEPLAPAIVCDHGSALRFAGRIQEAVGFFERCLELAPTWWASYANLLIAYPEVGRETDALTVLDQIFRLFGSSEDLASWESLSAEDDFQVVLSRTLEFLENGSGSGSLFLRGTYFLATLHLRAGQPDEAFRYLDSAVDLRHPSLAKSAMGGSVFAPIRDDPRYQALLERMGLKD